MKKSEFKALIKECLIEILSEGLPPRKSTPVRESQDHRSSLRSAVAPTRQVPLAGIPSSMSSLFDDSLRRVAEKEYQEELVVQKQHSALEQMGESFDKFITPLPRRGTDPSTHGGIPTPPPPGMPGMGIPGGSHLPEDLDDGFDPHEAMRAALPRRR